MPINVIEHFLETIERTRAKGLPKYTVCSLGVRLQPLESTPLRRAMGLLDDNDTGLRVTEVAPLAPCATVLKKDDVLLSVDGIKIANDGTIPFREGSLKERVSLQYHFTQKFEGDFVEFNVLRNGQRLKLTTEMWAPKSLIPRGLLQTSTKTLYSPSSSPVLGMPPSYLIVGGLVFIKLTREYMESEFNLKHMTDFELWTEEFKLLALTDDHQSCKEMT